MACTHEQQKKTNDQIEINKFFEKKKMKDKKNHPIKLIIHRYLFIFTIFTMNNQKNDE